VNRSIENLAQATRGPLDGLSFRYPFRKYQRMILKRLESESSDHRYHIIAPPGSGKTIVGLELVRRFGAPAVVFAPTTTIQEQWQERVSMFTDGPEQAAALTSLDPHNLAPINIFTYQLISTPGQAQELAQQLALDGWVEDLLAEGQIADEASARARIDTLRKNNPHDFGQELAHRYLRAKQRLLAEDGSDLAAFLHPNARRLIQSLVDYGVRTVVLDECHHLLDYWALVLRYLIRQIEDVRVVGLTATLPSPDDEQEYENYTALMGDVDFEVPTPAVIKEGDLAPYRDLVYFVTPTERECAYLHHVQSEFEEAVAQFTGSQDFVEWVRRLVLARPGPEGRPVPWEDFLEDEPLLSLAGMRLLRRVGYPIPSSLPVPLEAEEAMEMEDWLVLLERYALDVLKLSSSSEDHRRLADLRRVLLAFGMTITERGLRHGRSSGDLVLALSEAKDEAVANILAAESEALGERLRSVVVTDFETMSSGAPKALSEVLEPDAGSALRVFRYLASVERVSRLHPVLVTGSRLMAGAGYSSLLLDYFNRYLDNQGLTIRCEGRQTSYPDIVDVVGDRADWSSRVYVLMVTAALEKGLTKCVVGTRGIFGEGWDALTLNTLVDLTSVTTSAAVQQLRGRSIRLDPAWPRKVAHNWDVVCVAPEFKEGDGDLNRFIRRHSRYWGVTSFQPLHAANWSVSYAAQLSTGGSVVPTNAATSAAEPAGEIVKGVAHVDHDLAWDLARKSFEQINFDLYTGRMLAEVGRRDHSYDMWGVGQDYSDSSYSTMQLQGDDLKIHTVFTLKETLRRMMREFWTSLVLWFLFALGALVAIPAFLGGTGAQVQQGLAIALLLAATVALLINARSAYRLGKALLVEQRPDAILLDVGRALFSALRDAELVSRNLQPESIRITEQPDNSYRLALDSASLEDTGIFVTAYRQIFEPVRDQRYLILRDDTRLPSPGLAFIWVLARLWFGPYLESRYKPAYHPVPDVLAARKERATTFASYWSKYLGGGQLIFTRSEEGRHILLEARTQRRPTVKTLAFEVWR